MNRLSKAERNTHTHTHTHTYIYIYIYIYIYYSANFPEVFRFSRALSYNPIKAVGKEAFRLGSSDLNM